jgi:hydrogenase/urease accessory protein HupE
MSNKYLVSFVALSSSVAHAHPGEHHGGFFSVIGHLLSEPDHLILALLAVVIGAAGALYFRKRNSR